MLTIEPTVAEKW